MGLIDHLRSVGKEGAEAPSTPRGGERKDEYGAVYYIPADLIEEFDRMDAAITNDQDFWAWMREFVRKHNLWPSRTQQSTRSHVKASDWGLGHSYVNTKYYSDGWGGSKYYGYEYTGGETEKKLAVAIQGVQGTIRVVDSHDRRMRVQLAPAEAGGLSATRFSDSTIIVSSCALVDPKMELGDAVDVTTGFALHEASHAEYTENVLSALSEPTRLMPLAVSGFLFNLLEDIRIENETSKVFPGFTGYFEKAIEYMWEKYAKAEAPDDWGPTMVDKLNAIVAMIKWPTEYGPKIAASPALTDEAEWWRDLVSRYKDKLIPTRRALIEAMERLQLDPATKEEMEKMAQGEIADGLDKMRLEEALNEALDKLEAKGKKLLRSCSSLSNPMGVPKELEKGIVKKTLDRASRLAEEDFSRDEVEDLHFPDSEGRPAQIISLHPLVEGPGRRTRQSLVSRMRSAFLMRPSAMEWTNRLLKSGSVDDDELWRAGSSDPRFFEQRVVESAPDTSIALLVDISGSMGGPKVDAAIDIAQIMQACLKDMRGVQVRVFAHTGDTPDSGHGNAVVYRIWERGESLDRMGLLDQLQMGNNYDGYAIGWVVEDLLRHSRPDEQRVVFVLSDGLPHAYGTGTGYSGRPAMEHVRKVVNWSERQGVDVIQIAIDPHMRPVDQAVMFKHWVPFETLERLPSQIVQVMSKIL